MFRLGLFLLGGTSVASLLAWVMGVASFSTTFLLVTLPGQVGLVAMALAIRRRAPEVRTLLVAGLLGGLMGTLAYDLVRVPFVMAGFRVLAPIDSYGVLAAGAQTSSAWTGLLGWSFHFANGIGFGIAYAMLAPRRAWTWGIAWGLLLETVTIVTPFATTYGLVGGRSGTNWFAIGIAYAAHVPYGAAVGIAVQRRRDLVGSLAPPGRPTVPLVILLVVVGLVQWQAPWRSGLSTEGAAAADGPSAVVVDGVFHPEWLRVAVNGCVTLVNRDPQAWSIGLGDDTVTLAPGATSMCFPDAGVHRVRTSERPYAGGFVIVDPQ